MYDVRMCPHVLYLVPLGAVYTRHGALDAVADGLLVMS